MKKQFITYIFVTTLISTAAAYYLNSHPELFAELKASALHPHTLKHMHAFTLTALLLALPIVLLQIGAVWYFLSSLKAFSPGLRKAYRFLVIGLALFGFVQLQLPLRLLLSDLLPPAANLLFLVLMMVSTIILYRAMRRFAILLQLKSRWTRLWFMTVIALALAFIVAPIIPHGSILVADAQLRVLTAILLLCAAFASGAAMIAQRIYHAISAAYQPAIAWLTAALATMAFAYYQVALAHTIGAFIGLDTWYISYNFTLVPFILASVMFLRAGQRFKMVGSQYGTLSSQASALDIVIHTAALVSAPSAVEEILNPVRELTASRPKDAALRSEEIHQLTAVYLRLEEYLSTSEPLRKFNPEDLRARLPLEFRQSLPS